MDSRLLIDSIVQQTMVLIAQLSTTAGARSPLAHVADRVFLDLVSELERQRVGKKVIADMFGLALRSYQQKVQRLGESATDRGITLWAAIADHVAEKQVVGRADVLRRFRNDDQASVRGILNDLVSSGLIYRTGRGDATIYRHAAPEDLARVEALDPIETRASLVQLAVCRQGPITAPELAQQLRLDLGEVEAALARLARDGRVAAEAGTDGPRYRADSCVIPLGSRAGWEAAIIDHFQALVGAILRKVRAGARQAAARDEIGGSTFSFEIWPGHPLEGRVRGLLARYREELATLWDEVRSHGPATAPADDAAYKVTFYCGQNVETESVEEEP
jgi:hypothetical protein